MKALYILGIAALYSDSAAVLLRDGEIIAAAQEERFSRIKHDPSFPAKAVDYCLKQGGIRLGGLDAVSCVARDEGVINRLFDSFPGERPRRIFEEKHKTLAAAAFYPSPFREALVVAVDGPGPHKIQTCVAKGDHGLLELVRGTENRYSLGFLYSALTKYCGFKVNSGEYKLMGLAPYGEPRFKNIILDKLVGISSGGEVVVNTEYFEDSPETPVFNDRFRELFHGAEREPEGELELRYMDVASSAQAAAEELMLDYVSRARKLYVSDNLCLSGSFALNCKANGRLLREGGFKNVWIQPASTDAGGALGAAFKVWFEDMARPREPGGKDMQKGCFLGPSFPDKEIQRVLSGGEAGYVRLTREDLVKSVAKLIDEGNVVGWFQGRMEFGPRALGARSILADPRRREMRGIINEKIKFRENFRPFAPSVALDNAFDFFEMDTGSPYMLLTFPVQQKRRIKRQGQQRAKGLEKLNIAVSDIPAVTHVDYSARVQTVEKEDNPLFFDLLCEFRDRYGCPVLVNTSFNVRGEPIVCSPEDAYRCFMRTGMDYLAIGPFLVKKRIAEIDRDFAERDRARR